VRGAPSPQSKFRRSRPVATGRKQLRGIVFTPALFDKVVVIADNPLAK
jgi:hypothetical protein